MLQTRANHWSCGRFSRWVTARFGGAPKPTSATLEGWETWRSQSQVMHPFSYWVTETMLPRLQNILLWPDDRLHGAHRYLVNRFVSKTHCAQTGLKPGQYYPIDAVMLHSLFKLLVDFVEVELAWQFTLADQGCPPRFVLPWWSRWRLLHWHEWRCAEAGLALLDLEASGTHDLDWLPEEKRKLQPEYGQLTAHALAAQEQRALYLWWTRTRPARQSKISGLTENSRGASQGELPLFPAMSASSLAPHDAAQPPQAAFDQEDEQMLIRLIKARKHLWT